MIVWQSLSRFYIWGTWRASQNVLVPGTLHRKARDSDEPRWADTYPGDPMTDVRVFLTDFATDKLCHWAYG